MDVIREADCPAGVWNFGCPTCEAGQGFKCESRGGIAEGVHQARLDAYRADPSWSAEAEAEGQA